MYRLLIQHNNKTLPSVDLSEGVFSLGNTGQDDIPVSIDAPRFQLQLTVSNDWLVFNTLETDAPPFTLNGVTATESELKNGDTLILDSLQISVVSIVEPENAAQQDKDNDFSKHWSLQVRNGRMGGQRFKINNDRPTVIGRGKESDIIIPDPHLSKKHAEIRIFDQAPVVKDLNSAVGTYLNDAPVLESPLKSGDRLRMDIFSFLVLAPGEDSNIKPPSSKQTPQKTPEELLKNIQSLKNQEYEEKEWITKPTSVGNRTHVVPNSEKRFGVGFWVALVVTTACIFGSFFLLHNFA